MARELPIRNGRLTTDLDANGHKIKNLPPGEGFTQAQADWGETDSTKPSFIKRKPTIPAPMTVDSALSTTSENPVQNKVVTAALAEKLSRAEAEAGFTEWEFSPATFEDKVCSAQFDNSEWYLYLDGFMTEYTDSSPITATSLSFMDGNINATRTRIPTMADIPTKTSDLTNDSGFLTSHQDISGKADKSEMSVTPGTGANADKTTIQLKAGTSATVLTGHQTWSGVKPSGGIPKTDLASAVQTSLGKADTAVQPSGIAAKIPMYPMDPATVESGTLTVAPYTVSTYTADSTAAAFEVAVGALPAGVTGKSRDCILVIDCTVQNAVAPTVTWPSNFHPRTDTATDLAIVEAGKRAVFYISEYASGEFAVGGWTETAGGSGT